MRVFANIALWAYIPFVLGLFALMKNRRHAVIASFLIGWEFLPMDEIKLPLLQLSKVTACSAGVLMAVCVFDIGRVTSFRPKWYDIPMLVWCVCPFFTSLNNDLGVYDGASSTATQTLLWGLPYFIGRIYFNDFEGMRDLAVGIFIAGLAYIPFCLYEIKMSPQLHKMVYGHFQHTFAQTKRWGGFRPMVFMQSGIALGMWMTIACLVGVWLWLCGSVKQLAGIPMVAWVVLLLVVTVLCKSLSSLVFMGMGLGVLFWVKWFKNALPLYALLLAAPVYMGLRASGTWDGQNMVDMATKLAGEDRAQSLFTRVDAENKLTTWALRPGVTEQSREALVDTKNHNPWLGWGKWSPWLSYAPWRVGHVVHKPNLETHEDFAFFKDDAPTDGMWVITVGTFGLLGLISATVAILLPALLARKRIPLALWSHPMAAPVTVMAVILVLHMLDNLLNAMLNPIFVLAIGGISALGASGTRPVGRAAPARSDPGAGGFPQIAGLRTPPPQPAWTGVTRTARVRHAPPQTVGEFTVPRPNGPS